MSEHLMYNLPAYVECPCNKCTSIDRQGNYGHVKQTKITTGGHISEYGYFQKQTPGLSVKVVVIRFLTRMLTNCIEMRASGNGIIARLQAEVAMQQQGIPMESKCCL